MRMEEVAEPRTYVDLFVPLSLQASKLVTTDLIVGSAGGTVDV